MLKFVFRRIVFTACLCSFLPQLLFSAEDKKIPMISVQESKIENKTGVDANFRPLIDMVKHELFQAGFQVVDEADMGNALKEADKAGFFDGMEGKSSPGALKVPGYFVRASVIQYGFSASASRNPVSGNTTQIRSAQVQIAFTIVDARTARMQASANTKSRPVIVRTLEGNDVAQRGNFEEQALQTASQECIRQLVVELLKSVPKKFRPAALEGTVLKAQDNRILVKIDGDKVKIGDVLDIFKVEKLDEDDSDLTDEIYLCSVQITDVRPKISVCVPLSGESGKVAKGNSARISVRYKAPAAQGSTSQENSKPQGSFVPPF